MSKCCLFIFHLLFAYSAFGQLNESIYDFANLFPSARLSSTNGTSSTVNDSDLSSFYLNPALINEDYIGNVLLSYNNYISDINYLNTAYGFKLNDLGPFVAFVNYFDFGKFTEYDEFGQSIGEFGVTDYQIGLSHSRNLFSNFDIGATSKLNFSNYYRNNSLGMAFDIAVNYHSIDNAFNSMLRIRNLGFELISYGEKNYFAKPSVDIGFSQKLSKAPLRISMIYSHIETWNLSEFSKEQRLLQESTIEKLGFNNFMKHFTFGGSFIPSKNFAINISYNHKVREDMTLLTRGGLSGFAFGVDLKIKKIKIQYALNSRAIKGVSNQFTLISRFADWRKAKG